MVVVLYRQVAHFTFIKRTQFAFFILLETKCQVLWSKGHDLHRKTEHNCNDEDCDYTHCLRVSVSFLYLHVFISWNYVDSYFDNSIQTCHKGIKHKEAKEYSINDHFNLDSAIILRLESSKNIVERVGPCILLLKRVTTTESTLRIGESIDVGNDDCVHY